jgi:hypothetical protein
VASWRLRVESSYATRRQAKRLSPASQGSVRAYPWPLSRHLSLPLLLSSTTLNHLPLLPLWSCPSRFQLTLMRASLLAGSALVLPTLFFVAFLLALVVSRHRLPMSPMSFPDRSFDMSGSSHQFRQCPRRFPVGGRSSAAGHRGNGTVPPLDLAAYSPSWQASLG